MNSHCPVVNVEELPPASLDLIPTGTHKSLVEAGRVYG